MPPRLAFYRTILMTLYATGMRRAEVAPLKITDVDSARMVLHVQEGKGGRDRDIVLSPRLLEELRQHYRRLRRKPTVWLFPGGTHRPNGSLQVALSKTLRPGFSACSRTSRLPERFRYSPRTSRPLTGRMILPI